jgi:hypothetical protein
MRIAAGPIMPPWRIMPCFLHPSPILPSSAMHCRINGASCRAHHAGVFFVALVLLRFVPMSRDCGVI